MPKIARTRTAAARVAQQDQRSSSSNSSAQYDAPPTGKQRVSKQVRTKDAEVQVISCVGCGELGHDQQLCRSESSAISQISSCEDCIVDFSFFEMDQRTVTETFLCDHHHKMLAKRGGPTPAESNEAKFIVGKVDELMTMMGTELEEALEWLGVSAQDYTLAVSNSKE